MLFSVKIARASGDLRINKGPQEALHIKAKQNEVVGSEIKSQINMLTPRHNKTRGQRAFSPFPICIPSPCQFKKSPAKSLHYVLKEYNDNKSLAFL